MDKIKSQLSKKNFRYKSLGEDTLLVKLGFGLNCKIRSNKNDSIEVMGYLTAWNFATGLITINMKWLMAYNLIILFIVLGVIMYLKPEPFNTPFFYDFFLAWFILANVYYLIKFHYFKLLVYTFSDIK